MKIFLCRHGRTDYNDKDIVQGHMDVELNSRGEQQAAKLAERIRGLNIDHLYSSPLSRALQTADEVSSRTGLEINTLEDLKEVDQGVYEDEKLELLMEDLEGYEGEKHQWRPENGESMEECHDRACKVLKYFRYRHKGEKVAVIAHGGFNKTMLLAAIGHSSRNFNSINQGNCCLNEISWKENRGWVIKRVNDINHLE